jgi:hypothetical protein
MVLKRSLREKHDCLVAEISLMSHVAGLHLLGLDQLPLKPTKDGIAWSKDAKGEAHKNNLFAWIGAVSFSYWK